MKKSFMLLGCFALLHGLAPLSAQAQSPRQEVRVVYGPSTTSVAGQSASVLYSATGGASSTGLGIRVHFNSALVQIAEIEHLLQEASLGLQILEDTQDFDQDSSTDMFINAAWADLLGQWPASQGSQIELFTIAYDTLPGLEQTAFTVTDSAVAVGFEFAARVGE